MNSGKGRAWLRTVTNMIAATTRKPTSAPCDITRIPIRPTSLAFRKPATAIPPAAAAKTSGK